MGFCRRPAEVSEPQETGRRGAGSRGEPAPTRAMITR